MLVWRWVSMRLISVYCLCWWNELLIDFLSILIFFYNMYVSLVVILIATIWSSKYGRNVTFSCFHLNVTINCTAACIKIWCWCNHLIVYQGSSSRRLFVDSLWLSLWLNINRLLLAAIELRADDSMCACCLAERLLLLYLALIIEGKRFSFFIVWFALWVAIWIVGCIILVCSWRTYYLTLVLLSLRAVHRGCLRSHWWLARLL